MSPQPTFSGQSLEQLKELLDPLDSSPTECDGMTRLVSHYLTLNNVNHVIKTGCVTHLEWMISWHQWVELEDSDDQTWRIDYRCQMNLPDLSNVPHGIFLPEREHPTYTGATSKGKVLSERVMQGILMEVDRSTYEALLAKVREVKPKD